MFPGSSLSGISGASSSLNESVDLDVIEQIIERAPRNATSWPQVYRTYGEVLEEKWIYFRLLGSRS